MILYVVISIMTTYNIIYMKMNKSNNMQDNFALVQVKKGSGTKLLYENGYIYGFIKNIDRINYKETLKR